MGKTFAPTNTINFHVRRRMAQRALAIPQRALCLQLQGEDGKKFESPGNILPDKIVMALNLKRIFNENTNFKFLVLTF